MNVITLSTTGVIAAKAALVKGQRGTYYAVLHGEQGRGRWQVSLPLAAREFPCHAPAVTQAPHGGWECPNGHYNGYSRGPGYPTKPGDLCPECARTMHPDLGAENFRLHDLGRKDARGNQQFLLVRGRADGQTLVLWSMSPGYRGGASYKIEGQAVLVAEGYEAQGAAGRMGGAPCPIVLVSGPCRLTWTRSGRLYGGAASWVAEYDGETWTVAPVDGCAAEEAALYY